MGEGTAEAASLSSVPPTCLVAVVGSYSPLSGPVGLGSTGQARGRPCMTPCPPMAGTLSSVRLKHHWFGLHFPEPVAIILSEAVGVRVKKIVFGQTIGFHCLLLLVGSVDCPPGSLHGAPGPRRWKGRHSREQGLEGNRSARPWHEGGGRWRGASGDLDSEVPGAASEGWPGVYRSS